MKELCSWKKVLLADLDYVSAEVRELTELPACIILSGPVGAGKTTFIQHYSSFLSGPEVSNTKGDVVQITSPTYSLVNEQGRVAHADFYRLESGDEISHLELSLYSDAKDYFLVEWGMDYLDELANELGEQYSFYELRIDVNGPEFCENSSRNIFLMELVV